MPACHPIYFNKLMHCDLYADYWNKAWVEEFPWAIYHFILHKKVNNKKAGKKNNLKQNLKTVFFLCFTLLSKDLFALLVDDINDFSNHRVFIISKF